MKLIRDLWDDESGAVATEYIILTGLIAIALIGVLYTFRQKLADLVKGFGSSLDDGTKATGTGVGKDAN